jgi:hypothetical protein
MNEQDTSVDFDFDGAIAPVSPPIPEEKIERRGRPKGSTNEYKGLLTKEQIDRIRGRITASTKSKEEKKKRAAEEKRRRAVVRAEASAQGALLPVPEPIRKPNPPEEKKLHIKEAIERCIVLARATEGLDKTRMEAMLERLYLLAMDQGTDIEELLKTIQFFAERMEGKPQANNAPVENAASAPTLIVNIGTRFAPKENPKIEVFSVEKN